MCPFATIPSRTGSSWIKAKPPKGVACRNGKKKFCGSKTLAILNIPTRSAQANAKGSLRNCWLTLQAMQDAHALSNHSCALLANASTLSKAAHSSNSTSPSCASESQYHSLMRIVNGLVRKTRSITRHAKLRYLLLLSVLQRLPGQILKRIMGLIFRHVNS